MRHSDHQWAGLSNDLVIEQTLMRSMKSQGGITRRSGMTPSERNLWILSRPACAQVSHALEEFMEISNERTSQHKDSFQARITKDWNDALKLIEFFREHSPFNEDPCLRNIVTGAEADSP